MQIVPVPKLEFKNLFLERELCVIEVTEIIEILLFELSQLSLSSQILTLPLKKQFFNEIYFFNILMVYLCLT